jgi:hypothetical protein
MRSRPEPLQSRDELQNSVALLLDPRNATVAKLLKLPRNIQIDLSPA